MTGLYNRHYLIEYIDRLLIELRSKHKMAYLYLIDLDHFKTINDSLGHDIGDKLLQQVSKRILAFSNGLHTVSRIGGDEFAMISQEFSSKSLCMEESTGFAKKLLEVIKEPYVIEGHHLYLSASIGISYIDMETQKGDASKYMKEADIAMYEVKAQGRDGVIFFDEELAKRINRDLEIEKKLYFAFINQQIKLHYQPIFDQNSKIYGCEVLTRWHDDELGDIQPDTFIAIAENAGLIIELGNFILEEAFQTLSQCATVNE